MKVLVTGSTGYLGKHFIEQLMKNDGIKIIAIVRETTNTDNLGYDAIEIVRCDLKNQKKLKDCLEKINQVDVVFHLAAGLSGSYYELMMDSAVATENLLMALSQTKVQHFVLVSSFSVYKMDYLKMNGILDEDTKIEDKIKLRDSYAATKVQQERVVKKYCRDYNMKLTVIRPGKIYGPGTDIIPPQFGIKIPGVCFIMMGGSHLLPLIHVQNCADAIWRAGVKESNDMISIYNIVDSNLPTQNEFYDIYKRYFGKIKRLIKIPNFLFKMFVCSLEFISKISKENIPPVLTRYRYENLWKPLNYENAKAVKELSWKSEISIQSGLENTFSNELKRNNN